jgi:hypothetical protein
MPFFGENVLKNHNIGPKIKNLFSEISTNSTPDGRRSSPVALNDDGRALQPPEALECRVTPDARLRDDDATPRFDERASLPRRAPVLLDAECGEPIILQPLSGSCHSPGRLDSDGGAVTHLVEPPLTQ